MISRKVERAQRPTLSTASVRRFGPWPWYLSAADCVGFDLDVVDDIAGDLVEECAGLSTPASITASISARLWSVGQVVRALSYLAASTLRRGNPRARLRLLCAMGVLLVAATSVVAAIQLRVGPPARIAPDRAFDANDIVINRTVRRSFAGCLSGNTAPSAMSARALASALHEMERAIQSSPAHSFWKGCRDDGCEMRIPSTGA